jgi:hypothetical protein
MPVMAMPNADAESRSGGRRRRGSASHSASAEAPMAMATLAAIQRGSCSRCALACSALMPM